MELEDKKKTRSKNKDMRRLKGGRKVGLDEDNLGARRKGKQKTGPEQ